MDLIGGQVTDWNLTSPGMIPTMERILDRNRDEVTWLHSYVSDDGRQAFCVYDAPSPEAIRKSAQRNDLPVDSITCIRVLDPHQYFST